ncbi:MAG: GNAT family N-acetyltransferase [Clostridiales Family XIII bacterium]|jgi:GNAT superfamily N-acetyltransferase|nr:GNAT family N-acetyltransferase [Clostridiales Family XIII bacterium]
MRVAIRFAGEEDAALVLRFIKELAEFEGMGEAVVATESDIRTSLFERRQAEALIGEQGGEPIAFALFYPVYSTFLGGQNLFLEDLFVREAHRGKGVGRQMLQSIARIAAERGARRLDWYVLAGEASGARFYRGVGAEALLDRRVFRLEGERLARFAARSE